MNEDMFCDMVFDYTRKNPLVIPKLINTLTQALSEVISKEKQNRATVEVALIASLMKVGRKGTNTLLCDKLKEVNKFGSFNYDSIIKEMEKKND